eukprot:tig00000792_g4220.t1
MAHLAAMRRDLEAQGTHQASSPSLSAEDEEGLERNLMELQTKNEFLRRENEIFQDFLQSVAPQMANLVDEEEVKGTKKGRARSHMEKKKQTPLLTTENKLDIAMHEIDEVREKIEKTKQNAEKLLDNLRAIMEETDIRIAEIKKDAYEFKRDIVVGAENFRTGKTVAEKVVRYFEESLRNKESVIEKLRLKNATLKSQIQKMEAQLHQKEEMGETLHIIDFDQLKIENQQYLEKIDERNSELLRLKLTTGNTVQVLNSLKKKLNHLTGESEWLKQEIKSREELLVRIADETKRASEELGTAERQHERHQHVLQENAKVPAVLEYVETKAQIFDLEKEVDNYKRKIEIAEMNLQRTRQLARAASRSAGTSPRSTLR